MRVLCWFGCHDYRLNKVLHETDFGRLLGHSCVRCGAIPEGQKGLSELANRGKA